MGIQNMLWQKIKMTFSDKWLSAGCLDAHLTKNLVLSNYMKHCFEERFRRFNSETMNHPL